jgi:catechol 2,3-dioxygenase-like lactoylglutathione lyase family enzyme
MAPPPAPFAIVTGRILQISRVVADLARAEAFYRDAIGFRTTGRAAVAAAALTALGAAGATAEAVVMRLGAQEIALVRFAAQGRPYPPGSKSNDLWFQHLAIAVNDMAAAYAHLRAHTGWTPISDGGPQTLPPVNGRVQAFKFRDPDGHPLELIRFPSHTGLTGAGGPFLRIDHSALSVADTRRSVTFYRALGFRIGDRSLNHGPAQARLDGLPEATVEVTGLRPDDADSAGLELLAYRPPGRPVGGGSLNDSLTDWITLAVAASHERSPQAVRDPDGHRLLLVDHGGSTGAPA